MPLPKRPAKRGDVLTDYGPEADLTKPAGKAVPKAAAKPSQAPETASKPRRTTRKTVKAAPAKTTKTVEKTVTAQETAAPKSTAKTPAKPAVKKPPVKKAATAVKPQTAPAVAESDVRESRHSNRRGRAATPADKRKLFVLDTNVLIHDPMSIFSFAEHDVFLPMTVLEELDNHKKGTSDVARNARSVSRSLDQLMELNGHDLTQGVPLSLLGNKEATGRLFFETHAVDVPIPAALPTFKGDNRILAVVKGVEGAFPDLAVVLVSKDINMRIKATTLGIPAEDYLSDKVLDDTDMLYSGRMALPSDFWTTVGKSLKSWQDDGTTHYRFETKEAGRYVVNMCLTIEGDPDFMAIVTSVEPDAVTIRLLRDYRTRLKVWGIHARNAEQNMALNLLTDPEIDFVTLLGQAGTGKTLMTLAAALTQTIDERRFSEIIVTRATVSVGEDIGFLPGTEEEKMAPWMGALEDNLEVLHRSENSTGGDWGRQATLDLIKARIRIKSMSFMRGRTFLKKFVIIDEAQNLSPKQMKTLITRAGPGTKIVCLGNIAQIDTPYLTEGSSGLTYVVERFQGWPHAATITLTRGERSRLADFATEAL